MAEIVQLKLIASVAMVFIPVKWGCLSSKHHVQMLLEAIMLCKILHSICLHSFWVHKHDGPMHQALCVHCRLSVPYNRLKSAWQSNKLVDTVHAVCFSRGNAEPLTSDYEVAKHLGKLCKTSWRTLVAERCIQSSRPRGLVWHSLLVLTYAELRFANLPIPQADKGGC